MRKDSRTIKTGQFHRVWQHLFGLQLGDTVKTKFKMLTLNAEGVGLVYLRKGRVGKVVGKRGSLFIVDFGDTKAYCYESELELHVGKRNG